MPCRVLWTHRHISLLERTSSVKLNTRDMASWLSCCAHERVRHLWHCWRPRPHPQRMVLRPASCPAQRHIAADAALRPFLIDGLMCAGADGSTSAAIASGAPTSRTHRSPRVGEREACGGSMPDAPHPVMGTDATPSHGRWPGCWGAGGARRLTAPLVPVIWPDRCSRTSRRTSPGGASPRLA